jgi:hypothetical protein
LPPPIDEDDSTSGLSFYTASADSSHQRKKCAGVDVDPLGRPSESVALSKERSFSIKAACRRLTSDRGAGACLNVTLIPSWMDRFWQDRRFDVVACQHETTECREPSAFRITSRLSPLLGELSATKPSIHRRLFSMSNSTNIEYDLG